MYFVGQVFAKLIRENRISVFEYHKALAEMCKTDPAERVQSFAALRQLVHVPGAKFPEFTGEMRSACVTFIKDLQGAISELGQDAVFTTDIAGIQRELGALFRSVMLLTEIPTPVPLINCFVSGGYTYYRNKLIGTQILKAFIDVLALCSDDQKNIVIANVHSMLGAMPRKKAPMGADVHDSDIPF